MYIFEKNSSRTTMKDWIEACFYEATNDMVKLEDEDSIVILSKDDLLKICKYLSGEDREIPSLRCSEDILGDIEGGDCNSDEEYYYSYFECTVEYLDVVNTRYSVPLKNPNEEIRYHEDNDGTYLEFRRTGRKGYPSFLFKIYGE